MNKVLLRNLTNLLQSTPLSDFPKIINDNNKFIVDNIQEFYDTKRDYTGNKFLLAPVVNNSVVSKTGKFANLSATNLSIENIELIEPVTKIPFGAGDIILKRHLDTERLDYVNGKLTVIDKSDELKCPIDSDVNGNVYIGVNATVPTDKTNVDNLAFGNRRTLSKLSESNICNLAIGHNVLGNLTDGSNNVVIGNNSATSITLGSGNLIIGPELTLDGVDNINNKFLIGSGINPDYVYGDIELGTFVLNSSDAVFGFKNDINLSSSNRKNIFIGGNDVLMCSHKNSNNNIFIGNDISNNITLGDNNIFIGHNAGFRYSGEVNNMLAIGIVSAEFNIPNPIIEANLASNILKLNATTIELYGDIKFAKAMRTSGGGTVVGIDKNNNLVKFTSSKRYKTDIKLLDKDESKTIYNIECITYKPKDSDDTRTYYGFLAEDVARVNNKLVGYANVDGVDVVDSVMYDRFVVLLLNEIKQHEKTIKNLQERISILEKNNK